MAARTGIEKAFGILLAVNMAMIGLSPLVPMLVPAGGGVTLIVLVLGFVLIKPSQRVLTIALVAVGIASLVTAYALGHRIDLLELLALNQVLIGMLVAVSFVRTIARDAHDGPSRLRGAPAVWRTAAMIHVLGAVINLSAVNIVGDHLARHGKLSLPNALLLSRAFSAGAFWSPFWAASAVAFAYAPGAQPAVLVVCGIILAIAALGFSIATVVRAYRDDLPGFTGYTVSWRLLRIPLALAALVIAGHLLLPSLDLSVIVLLASLAVTLGGLAIGRLLLIPRIIGGHIVRGLPVMRGEVTLFTAAGILSVGLRALVDATGISAPVAEFTVLTAWIATIVMTLLSFAGVHPVISIATLGTLFAPTHPDPTLFAMASVIAWGTAAAVGPISGLNVYLAGRFDVNGFQVARRNLPYLAVVLVLSFPVLTLCAMLS